MLLGHRVAAARTCRAERCRLILTFISRRAKSPFRPEQAQLLLSGQTKSRSPAPARCGSIRFAPLRVRYHCLSRLRGHLRRRAPRSAADSAPHHRAQRADPRRVRPTDLRRSACAAASCSASFATGSPCCWCCSPIAKWVGSLFPCTTIPSKCAGSNGIACCCAAARAAQSSRSARFSPRLSKSPTRSCIRSDLLGWRPLPLPPPCARRRLPVSVSFGRATLLRAVPLLAFGASANRLSGRGFPVLRYRLPAFNWWMFGGYGIHTSVFPSAHVAGALSPRSWDVERPAGAEMGHAFSSGDGCSDRDRHRLRPIPLLGGRYGGLGDGDRRVRDLAPAGYFSAGEGLAGAGFVSLFVSVFVSVLAGSDFDSDFVSDAPLVAGVFPPRP